MSLTAVLNRRVPPMCLRCVERHLAGILYDVLTRATFTGEYQPWSRDHAYALRRDSRDEAREYVAANIRSWYEPYAGA